MKCSLCTKEIATVHLTEIINNQMVEVHLCEACAEDKGTAFKTHFNFSDVLSGFSNLGESIDKVGKKTKKSSLKCSKCSMNYDEFGECGRLGCPDCYEAFGKMLLPLIKRVQRTTHHIGKKPTKIPAPTRTQHDLRMLQDRLRQCVQQEAFEEAADLRDQIKKILEKTPKKKPKK